MSKMRIVIFGLAFGSAIMAGLLAKGFIGQKPDKEIVEINKVKTVDVLTASKDINMRTFCRRLNHVEAMARGECYGSHDYPR